MWRSTFATSSSSSAPRMTTPSLSHSNSLATVTPVCRLEGDGRARTFPRPFVDLSKLGRDGRSAGDANPALRQAPSGAGRPAGRGGPPRGPGGGGRGAGGRAAVASRVARRPVARGENRPWLQEWRRRLEDVQLRGLECFAQARLNLGGPTLSQAEDCARRLIELVPTGR